MTMPMHKMRQPIRISVAEVWVTTTETMKLPTTTSRASVVVAPAVVQPFLDFPTAALVGDCLPPVALAVPLLPVAKTVALR